MNSNKFTYASAKTHCKGLSLELARFETAAELAKVDLLLSEYQRQYKKELKRIWAI